MRAALFSSIAAPRPACPPHLLVIHNRQGKPAQWRGDRSCAAKQTMLTAVTTPTATLTTAAAVAEDMGWCVCVCVCVCVQREGAAVARGGRPTTRRESVVKDLFLEVFVKKTTKT